MSFRRKHLFYLTLLMGVIGLYLFSEWKMVSSGRVASASNNVDVAEEHSIQETLTSAKEAFRGSGNIAEKNASTLRQVVQQKNIETRFFGRVIDQNGEPVSGATVLGYIRQWKASLAYVDAEIIRFSKKTDVDGRFEILDIKGDGVFLEAIVRTGYQFSKTTFGRYPSVQGTREIPMVFTMWKLGKREPLVNQSKRWRLIPDGRSYTIDLLKGERALEGSGNGDIRISIDRPKGVIMSQKYDWTFKMEAVDGGILETQDEFMNLAPTDGYQAAYIWNPPLSDPTWTPLLTKRFFIKTQNGKHFGCMSLEVKSSYQNESAIVLEYRINPNSSPVLEP